MNQLQYECLLLRDELKQIVETHDLNGTEIYEMFQSLARAIAIADEPTLFDLRDNLCQCLVHIEGLLEAVKC